MHYFTAVFILRFDYEQKLHEHETDSFSFNHTSDLKEKQLSFVWKQFSCHLQSISLKHKKHQGNAKAIKPLYEEYV